MSSNLEYSQSFTHWEYLSKWLDWQRMASTTTVTTFMFNVSSTHGTLPNITSLGRNVESRPLYRYLLRGIQTALGFYGNLIFLLAMSRMRKLYSNMHIMMISLALVDICGSATFICGLIWEFLVKNWKIQNKLCITTSFLSREILILNILHLCLMALERWTAVTFPHR